MKLSEPQEAILRFASERQESFTLEEAYRHLLRLEGELGKRIFKRSDTPRRSLEGLLKQGLLEIASTGEHIDKFIGHAFFRITAKGRDAVRHSGTICARCGKPIPVNYVRAYDAKTGEQFHADCA